MQEKTRKKDTFFVINFRNPMSNKIVSLKAGTIRDSSLGLSFIEVSDFKFNLSGPVINPAEEELKSRYEGVKRLHLTIYSVLSIEEVGEDHKGLSFQEDKSKLIVLPKETPPN